MITLTEPIGAGWSQGQLALGAELIAFHTDEPITAYGAGLTPKFVYTATAFGRVRPFVEAGGGFGPSHFTVARIHLVHAAVEFGQGTCVLLALHLPEVLGQPAPLLGGAFVRVVF